MSDQPVNKPQPLFPPRPVEEPISPAPAAPPPPPPPPRPDGVNVDLAGRIERIVAEVFARRFTGQPMPWQQARALASLEFEVVGELVRMIARDAP